MKKGELKRELGVSTTKFNSVFNTDVIERIIGISYSDFKRMRILPLFIETKLRLYWEQGDVYVPEEGIYINSDGKKWVIKEIDNDSRTVTIQELDKYGMLGDVVITGVTFKIIRTVYKKID
jgi:hypothetical protein